MMSTPIEGVNVPVLVMASVLIAIMSSYAALGLAGRLAVATGRARVAWLIGGSFAMGVGIWSMHFVAMLGFRLPIPVAYDVVLVSLSVIAAVVASAIALSVAARSHLTKASVVGGALAMGIAIACMHYTGMAAMRLDAQLHYDGLLVVASCVIAVTASGVALWLAFKLREERRRITLHRLAAAVVMGFAIAGMHYTGMAAVHFLAAPTGVGAHAPGAIGGTSLVWLTGLAALVILGAALASAAIDRRVAAGTLRTVPPALLWSCLGLTVTAVLMLLFLNRREDSRAERVLVSERSIERAITDLVFLDEALSMTARLAVLTDDPRWQHRYDSLDTQMRDAHGRLRTAAAVSGTSASMPSLLSTGDLLLRLERRALAERAAYGPGAGDSLLMSAEYTRGKHEYVAAMREITESIDVRIESDRSARKSLATVSAVVGLATLLLVAIAWAGLVLLLRAHLAEVTLRSIEENLAREMAQAANKSKSEFLATMSHELRTPLTAVIGFANILHKNKGNRLSPADLAYVARIQNSGRHLLGLINEVLDLAKLDSGRIDVVLAPTEICALVRNAAALIENRREGLVRIALDVPTGDLWLETDGARLTQIVVNLLGNAVKFTERGTVTLRLLTERSSDEGARVEVSDTGVGIPPDRLDAIFQPFEQADNTTARMHGGTGLGLAISLSIAMSLGCTLTVKSTVGVGSTFTLTLPPGNEARAATLFRPLRRQGIR